MERSENRTVEAKNRAAEEWLFETIVTLEEERLLPDFYARLGLIVPANGVCIVETVWPYIRDHYCCRDGRFDLERACRDMLGFSYVKSLGR